MYSEAFSHMVTPEQFTYKLNCKNSPEQNTGTKDFFTELVTSTQKPRLKNKNNELQLNIYRVVLK